MKNDKEFNLYKNFLDLIPEPIVVINKNDLKILFANLEFQIHFERSFSKIKEISLDNLFNKRSFLISNLKKLRDKIGMFLIKESYIIQKFFLRGKMYNSRKL